MAWKEVSPRGELIKWDEPKTIEGVYLGGEERSTDFGTNVVHSIRQDNGEIISFFGTAHTNEALKSVSEGTRIQVEYTGKTRKTTRGFRVKEFIVRVWEDETAPSD